MLKKIGLVLAALVIVILVLASFQPKTFRVERAAVMNAKPAVVFAQFNDLHNWMAWSPWEKRDPAMKRTYDGPKSGKGAGYGWDGNGRVGAGRMTIVESTAPSRIVVDIDFSRPMVAHDKGIYTFTKVAGGTEVRWAMEGQVPFVGRIFHLFTNMDKMIGGDFETGLANLKTIVEKKK